MDLFIILLILSTHRVFSNLHYFYFLQTSLSFLLFMRTETEKRVPSMQHCLLAEGSLQNFVTKNYKRLTDIRNHGGGEKNVNIRLGEKVCKSILAPTLIQRPGRRRRGMFRALIPRAIYRVRSRSVGNRFISKQEGGIQKAHMTTQHIIS